VQQQKARGFRGFVQTSVGRALLIALTILVVFATFSYAGVLFAIPVFLIVGLALPIYAGLKRPRYLALAGVVVILLVPPIATAVLTSELMTAGGASSSYSGLPEGHGGSVLQNAYVSPFTGSTSTNFTWNVTIYPQYLSPSNSTPLWISLYISTCPGATGNDSPNCNTPYPFTNLTHAFTPSTWTNGTPVTVSFHYAIGADGLWYWQMGLAMRNLSTGALNWIFLVGDPQFDGIQGPVVGNYLTVYSAVVGTVYLDTGLFLGGSYFFILLLYVILKNRQQRRTDSARRRAPPVPTPTSPTGGETAPLPSAPPPGAPPPVPSSAAAQERNCPNCKAVVYQNEATCWKCGAALPPTKT
jgi:hypothetical protein